MTTVTGATDGLLRNRQTVVLAQALASGDAAPPQGGLRTVLVGLVLVDAVRVPDMRVRAPRALVAGVMG